MAGSVARSQSARAAGADAIMAATTLCIPNSEKGRARSVGEARSVRSMRSTRSRRSKWGDDDAEPLGDVKRRQFEEVRWRKVYVLTPVPCQQRSTHHRRKSWQRRERAHVAKVGLPQRLSLARVRCSSRPLVEEGKVQELSPQADGQHGPGMGGYTGLKILGNVPITIGSRTAIHNVMLSEEQHFDVVLGRQWVEKMNVK